jgi:hypothetical protein
MVRLLFLTFHDCDRVRLLNNQKLGRFRTLYGCGVKHGEFAYLPNLFRKEGLAPRLMRTSVFTRLDRRLDQYYETPMG